MTYIIGLDPGSQNAGCGIVRLERGALHFVHCETIHLDIKVPFLERMYALHHALSGILAPYQNEECEAALEDVFVSHNIQSALKLGQARGVMLGVLSAYHIKAHTYAARKIKEQVAGNGALSKEAVRSVVLASLSIAQDIQIGLDASDALACAICHAKQSAKMHLPRVNSHRKRKRRLSQDDVAHLMRHHLG